MAGWWRPAYAAVAHHFRRPAGLPTCRHAAVRRPPLVARRVPLVTDQPADACPGCVRALERHRARRRAAKAARTGRPVLPPAPAVAVVARRAKPAAVATTGRCAHGWTVTLRGGRAACALCDDNTTPSPERAG